MQGIQRILRIVIIFCFIESQDPKEYNKLVVRVERLNDVRELGEYGDFIEKFKMEKSDAPQCNNSSRNNGIAQRKVRCCTRNRLQWPPKPRSYGLFDNAGRRIR